jgi:hypothetical protein
MTMIIRAVGRVFARAPLAVSGVEYSAFGM